MGCNITALVTHKLPTYAPYPSSQSRFKRRHYSDAFTDKFTELGWLVAFTAQIQNVSYGDSLTTVRPMPKAQETGWLSTGNLPIAAE